MRKRVLKLVSVAAFVFAAGLVSAANGQTVSGSIPGGKVTAGKTAKATVYLSIPSGLHVNSSRPGSEYAIATRVTATSSGGVKIGPVLYPRGKNRKFGFSEDTINVYEGRTPFTFNVTVPANYKKYSVVINVSVRYQACTDEVCYPPKTKTARITASVL
ncbi:MAG: protein-disulfide reductase DsbD N-terminal domain-containing protein [Pyrinomonadaceae bacterium]|nr:protein-disulfide reductase DsbD N-terminal domain-containing protein [Acidobacteriota bacterium]MBK7932596.1 protein-disulfide reductase DsbD N-terminal domain-containing protein [Acidobacteriota bacterium]MBP7377634.1 protein-disulfide reductase DsbD N-terminal domain-containing protein [Pyrinomonadaceae bacterium]